MVTCGHQIKITHPDTELIGIILECAKSRGHDGGHAQGVLIDGTAGERQVTVAWSRRPEDD